MANWFSERLDRANQLVKEAQRIHQATTLRTVTVEEAVAEQEDRARRVGGVQGAHDLLTRWSQLCEGNQLNFPFAAGATDTSGVPALSFHQVLLRSRAFELFVSSCGRVPPLRGQLRSGDGEPSALASLLSSVAKRVLLPGAQTIWSSLLDIMLSMGDSFESGAPTETDCAKWAFRALGLLKRKWQNEALPGTIRRLDNELTALVSKPVPGADEHGVGAELRATKGGRMTKRGIRAALVRDQFQLRTTSAGRAHARMQILCTVCERLEAAERSDPASSSDFQQLLEDADTVLFSLDDKVKTLNAEQENLKNTLGEVGGVLEGEITKAKETISEFTEKVAQLNKERRALLQHLEEVDMHLQQVTEAKEHVESDERALQLKLEDVTAHIKDNIAGSFCRQKQLAEEKLLAVASKVCAHTAVDVAQAYSTRFRKAAASQLEKRRPELQRSCPYYLQQERLRVEAARECLSVCFPKPSTASGVDTNAALLDDFGAKALSGAQEAWQEALVMLRRVRPLVSSLPGEVPSAMQDQNVDSRQAEVPDPVAFFSSAEVAGQGCVDCGSPTAEWASVSHGTYLCMNCAGQHRGLGVHLSFVRSTTMDMWSQQQLRRMQLGGTPRFRRYIESYAKLRESPQTPAQLSALYSSRAAAYYRRRLDLECDGREVAELGPAPPLDEGHLEADAASLSQTTSSRSTSGRGTGIEDAEMPVGSLEEERSLLQEAYLEHQRALPLAAALQAVSPTAPEQTRSSSSGAVVSSPSNPRLNPACVPEQTIASSSAARAPPPPTADAQSVSAPGQAMAASSADKPPEAQSSTHSPSTPASEVGTSLGDTPEPPPDLPMSGVARPPPPDSSNQHPVDGL